MISQDRADERPLVAMAGASGFVGTLLRDALANEYRWIALTRSETRGGETGEGGHTCWRHCDLFSLPQVERALQGARSGMYLVHSMLPSSRLMQAQFEDLDLLLADNFARGAKAAGLEHIIYLGGLLPREQGELSPHLKSRLEVENVLRQSGIPVTVLRAGLIVGPGGSSTRMLINLVRRLPFMILPRWTRSRTQSIDVRDVIRAFRLLGQRPERWGETYDIAGHPAMTYRQMIDRTGDALNLRPLKISYPYNSIKLSRLWVQCISGVSAQLVNPLLESLTHNLEAQPNPMLSELLEGAVSFERSVLDATDRTGFPFRNPREESIPVDRSLIRNARRVRSVQRLPLPVGWDAEDVANAYGNWLTRCFRGLIQVDKDLEGVLRFRLCLLRPSLLELTPTPYSREGGLRRAFYVTGGLLARRVEPPGRLEFRIIPCQRCIIAALHGFAPRLPWWLYIQSQARIHLWVMQAFGRYLDK